jgi:hypothetical protein
LATVAGDAPSIARQGAAPTSRLAARIVAHRVFGLLATLVLGAMIAFPLGVIASHQFSDVPNTNTYHADIDALADAGVTTGCGDGSTYCPSAFVTREQMAAFMNRLGALGAGKTPVVNATKLDGIDSSQFVRSDVELAGTFECEAAGMHMEIGSGWINNGLQVYPAAEPNVFVNCQVSLPDGATITQVRWSINDTSGTDGVQCYVLRFDASDGVITVASAESTGAATPGVTTLTDATLLGALIDNAAYQYVGRCVLYASNSATAFRWIALDYTVAGLPMP